MDGSTAKVIVECAACQCVKVPVYAALAGVLNARQPSFGPLILAACLGDARALVGEPNLLRFAAELCRARVLSSGALAALYRHLLGAGDTHRDLIVVSLPWAASAGLDRQVCEEIAARFSDEKDVEALRANDWQCGDACIARPSLLETDVGRPHEYVVEELVSSPSPSSSSSRATFRCLDAAQTEDGLMACDRLVTECYVLDTCRHCNTSLSLAVDRLLLTMPVQFRYDWILVETLFGRMLYEDDVQLPALFYHALLANLLRNQVRLAGIYFRVVDKLFMNMDTLDPNASQRLVEWFATHLSNFAFKWEWNQWVSAIGGLGDDHPRILFLRATLGRCVRLSYWARVEKSLPPSMRDYMPPFPKPSEVEDASALSEPQQLVLTVLREGTTHSLLKAGVRRHGSKLRELSSTDETKVSLLQVVGRFWANSEGHRLMVADALLTGMIVDQMAIVSWIFSEHSAGSLISYAPWEVLHMALRKTVERTKALVDALAAAPTSTQISEKLELQRREEKDVFLTTFQRFSMVLESYLAQTQAMPGQENSWFRSVLAQMVAFGRRYRATIAPFVSTLESFVFSDGDCDVRIRSAFAKSLQQSE